MISASAFCCKELLRETGCWAISADVDGRPPSRRRASLLRGASSPMLYCYLVDPWMRARLRLGFMCERLEEKGVG
jgi:hypothetical protein